MNQVYDIVEMVSVKDTKIVMMETSMALPNLVVVNDVILVVLWLDVLV